MRGRYHDLEQLYPTSGAALVEMGFEIPADDYAVDYWYRLVIDKTDEARYLPMRADRFERLGEQDEHGAVIAWVEDKENSGLHGWPCIPVIWVKAPKGNRIDGQCLYDPIKDMLVEVDYMLSLV